MDILAMVVLLLFVAMVACWVILPGTSTVAKAETEIESASLVPSQQTA